MPSLTQPQQWTKNMLRDRYGHARALDAGQGTVLILASTQTQTVSRLMVDARGRTWPATGRELRRVMRLATAHVRSPCPACSYPARPPSCPRCRTPISHDHDE